MQIEQLTKDECAQIVLESAMIGIANRIGDQEGTNAFLNQFVQFMAFFANNAPKEEVESIMDIIKEQLEPAGIEIEYKLSCCPHKKKKEEGE